MAKIQSDGCVLLDDQRVVCGDDNVMVGDLAELVSLLSPPPLPQKSMINMGGSSWSPSSGGKGQRGQTGPIGPQGPPGPSGSASGWTDDGAVVRLTTSTDQVVIGAAVPFGTEKVAVIGDTIITGRLAVGTTAFVGSETALFENDQNSATFIRVKNANNTALAESQFVATVSTGPVISGIMGATAALFTPALGRNAGEAYFTSDPSSTPVAIITSGAAPIRFVTNSIEAMRINSIQNVMVATTVDLAFGPAKVQIKQDTASNEFGLIVDNTNVGNSNGIAGFFSTFGFIPAAAVVQLHSRSSTVGNGQGIGFFARNAAATDVKYVNLSMEIMANGAGIHSGDFVVYNANAGTITETFRVKFNGDAIVTGKLTVAGAIDPTSILLSGGTALFYESNNGSTAPVSGPATGRIRYNNTSGTWQVSTQGSIYVDLQTGAGVGGWTDTGTLIQLTTTTDNVTIGGTTNLAKFTVQGDTDEIQLRVRGNSTQTSNLVQYETSVPSTLWSLSNSGDVSQSGVLTLGGDAQISRGAADRIDIGTGDSFRLNTSGSAATPVIQVNGSDIGMYLSSSNVLGFSTIGTERMTLQSVVNNGDSSLSIQTRIGSVNSLQAVHVGAADSGGTGFRALSVPN